MEQWGTGVQRVFEQIAEAGLPELHVEEVMDRLRFTVYVSSHAPDARLGANDEHQDSAPSEQDVSKSREQAGVPGEDQVSINAYQVSINLASGTYGLLMLRAAVEEPVSRDALLEGAGLSTAYGNYTRHVLPLIDARLLEFTHPENPRHRGQRYRLTDLGRRVLAEHDDE
jgi:hypothetical protein